MWLLAMTILCGGADTLVDTVKNGYLDMAPYQTVGIAFSKHRWFVSTTWEQQPAGGGGMVTFTGVIPDDEAVKNFYERKKYAFNMGLKAMQLEPTYGLTEDKVKLSFIIRFAVDGERRFKVDSGSLGILSKAGEWRERPLPDKALLEIIRGIYIQRNPYESLILGLPFK